MKIKLRFTPDDEQPHEGYLYCTDQFGHKWQRTTWFGNKGQEFSYMAMEDVQYVQECYNGHGGHMLELDNGHNDERPIKIGSIYGKTKLQVWYYNRQLKKQWKARQKERKMIIQENKKSAIIL